MRVRLPRPVSALGLGLLLHSALLAQPPAVSATPARTLPAGTLLRVQIDRTSKLKLGTSVTGHLLDPVFLSDREVLPAGSLVTGHVAGSMPVPAKDRIWALLNGDVTPTRTPRVRFRHRGTAQRTDPKDAGVGGRTHGIARAHAECTKTWKACSVQHGKGTGA